MEIVSSETVFGMPDAPIVHLVYCEDCDLIGHIEVQKNVGING